MVVHVAGRAVRLAVVVADVDDNTYFADAVPARLNPVAVTVLPLAAAFVSNVAVPPTTVTSSVTVKLLVNVRVRMVAAFVPS